MKADQSGSPSDSEGGPPSALPALRESGTNSPALEVRFISGKNLTKQTLDQYDNYKLTGTAPNTSRLCRTAVERFLRYIESRRNADLLLVYVEYMRMINASMAPKTYQRERGRVESFLMWARDMGYIEAYPPALCRAPAARITHNHEKIISPADYLRICAACDEMGNTAVKELIMTGYWTGMSIADSSLLRWDCVDIDSMIISSERVKTRTKVEIPIVAGSEFHRYLVGRLPMKTDTDWPNDPARGIFFVNTFLAAAYHAARNERNASLSRWIKKAFTKAGMPRHTFHDLRRAMATVLANSIPVGHIMRVMGWKNPAMVATYLAPGHSGLREEFDKAMKQRDETTKRVLHHRSLPPPDIRSFEHPQIEDDPVA